MDNSFNNNPFDQANRSEGRKQLVEMKPQVLETIQRILLGFRASLLPQIGAGLPIRDTVNVVDGCDSAQYQAIVLFSCVRYTIHRYLADS